MKKLIEIQVSLEDKPGTMAALCSTLGTAGVNITALMAMGGAVKLLVNDVPRATDALKGAGYKIDTKEVATPEVPNKISSPRGLRIVPCLLLHPFARLPESTQ